METYKRKAALLWVVCSISCLGGCSMIPGKSFHTHIDIDATPKAIWTVLADTARYPKWNPYHVKVVGRLETGQSLEVLIHKPNREKVEIAPQVFRIEPERELTWGGGIQGLFFGEHVFLIEPMGNQRSRLTQKETFTGIFVPFASLGSAQPPVHRPSARLKRRESVL